jgi:hypothetical protein
MPMPVIHDWRPGDRVASIAVREPLAETGLGTIQRVILDKAVVLWDDGEQSLERLPDLIIGGFDKSKIVFDLEEQFGQQTSDWFGGKVIGIGQSDDLKDAVAIEERIAVSTAMITGIPLTLENTGLKWGSFINENFKQGS